jgi:hypothetical protein
MSDDSESSYDNVDDSSFSAEEIPKVSSVKRKSVAKRTSPVLALSDDEYSSVAKPKPKSLSAKRKSASKKKKASPVLELSDDDDSSSIDEEKVSVKAKPKAVPVKRKAAVAKTKKKTVKELSSNDDKDSKQEKLTVAMAKKKSTVKRKPTKKAVTEATSDTDSSYNSMELDIVPTTKIPKNKVVLELSEEDSCNEKITAKPKAKVSVKMKHGAKDDEEDSSAEGKQPPKSPAKLKAAKKRKSVTNKVALDDHDAFDIILPPNLVSNTNGECTVLVQIDPDDAAALDFTGAVGAVGRMEADDERGKAKEQ